MVNGTQMTLDQWMPDASPTPIVGVSVFPVRTSQLQESNSDLLETARHSFSELCTWLDNSKKKKDPLICSLRTLKICLVLMEDGTSPGFSLKWTSGSKVFPVEGADGADNIYGIGHRNGYRRNIQIFDPDGITEALDTGQGGGRGHHTIEVIAYTRESTVKDRTRILSGGGISHALRATDHKDPVKVGLNVSEILTRQAKG